MGKVQDQVGNVIRESDMKCPVCQSSNWETGRIYDESKLRYTGPTEPVKPENYEAVCAECGYVVTFKIANVMKHGAAQV